MLNCSHPTKLLVWTRYNNCAEELTTRRLRYQCLGCGMLVGGNVAYRMANEHTPDADLDALKRHDMRCTEARAQARAERRAAYVNYMQSPEWRDRRARVLKRAGGMCEGCLQDRATQIHHTTYAHFGDELMFELLALCRRCHEKIHGLRHDI
jgi:hypothetical protein